MTPHSGQLIGGRYELKEAQGVQRGPWSMWLAQDTKFGEHVQLRIGMAVGPDDKARVVWAARMTHRVARAKGIVRVLDWGEEEGVLFQALDSIPNARPLDLTEGSLMDRLNRLGQATEVVAGLHRSGVLHLDLSPARFLIGPDELHVTGFESARCAAESKPPPLPPPSTPEFVAPERLKGIGPLTPASDVFSLGAMLHVIFFRRPPGEKLPIPPVEPQHRPLVDLVQRACASDPAKRPSLEEFAAALKPTGTGKLIRRTRLPALPEGFMGWEELRRVSGGYGARAVVEALGNRPIIVVRRERPVLGRTTFLGRCAPVRGKTDGPVTLGRAPDADLRMELPTVSSKHLTFAQAGPAWSLTDTSSNGTSLQGAVLKRGSTRTLADRDTICLSDHVWLQFLLPSTLLGLLREDAEPLAFEVEDGPRAAGPAMPDALGVSSFVGRIAGTELVEFLQLIELNQRSGVLLVSTGGDPAQVSIREGKLVDGRFGAQLGEPAIRRVLSVRSGTFAFTAGPVEPGPVLLPISPLLLEVMREADEQNRKAKGW